MITIVDYGRGNLYSLGQALRHLGVPHRISEDPKHLADATRIIVPGVGAFGDAMAGLETRGLEEPIKNAAARGIPILGICLGMQMLATESEEFGLHRGLDLIPGRVSRLPEGSGDDAIRVPNVGWRALRPSPTDELVGDLQPDSMVYFVHSYVPFPTDAAHVAATIPMNGHDVAAITRNRNVIGYQFHPEKSGPVGLDLLRRFVEFRFT
jgi:glutamine amidotransferase